MPVNMAGEEASGWSPPASEPAKAHSKEHRGPLNNLLPIIGALLAMVVSIFYRFHTDTTTSVPSTLDKCRSTFNYGFPIDVAVHKVRTLQSHSWEYSTATQALLELHSPELTPFTSNPFPADKIPHPGQLEVDALTYIRPHISTNDEHQLHPDNFSATDPASLGTLAILLGQSDPCYLRAASRQKDYLLQYAPRYSNRAISHRKTVAELWSDAVNMFPPFLAYYAVVSNDMNLIREAVAQCGLYRDVCRIREGPRRGLWRHIVGPSEFADAGIWSTGVAWAAYGILRVRATVVGWRPSKGVMGAEVGVLDRWVLEILDGVIRTDDLGEGLLRNYLGDEGWFGETSGTALLAAVVYRMAVLGALPERERYLFWADAKRRAVMERVDEDGVAKPAVNPLKHGQREPLMTGSPEGQSFLVMMAAAWRDCVCSGTCT